MDDIVIISTFLREQTYLACPKNSHNVTIVVNSKYVGRFRRVIIKMTDGPSYINRLL